jgi:hypothetical protein
MEPALAEILGPRPREPRTIVTLWRMQGPSRVMTARIERHPCGRELVIAFDGDDSLIETRFERLNFALLERRADEWRDLLTRKGWTEMAPR